VDATGSSRSDIARRLPRHEADNRVTITLDKSGGRVVRGRCINVSEAGFGAVLAGEVEPGPAGDAKLTLQGLEEPLLLRAEVRNRHGFTHGFQFHEISPEQRRTLMRWVRAASHEDTISLDAAHAMNTEHSDTPHEPGESTGQFPALGDEAEPKDGE
jgi:hypothetical protein